MADAAPAPAAAPAPPAPAPAPAPEPADVVKALPLDPPPGPPGDPPIGDTPAPADPAPAVPDDPAPPTDAEAHSTGKVGTALRAAKERGPDEYAADIKIPKLPLPKYREISVAGEKVRIEETDFVEPANGDVVSFRKKYFPEEDEEFLKKAPFVFNKVFTYKAANGVMPPCDIAERQIIRMGLDNRIMMLLQEIHQLRNREGDVAHLRAKIGHYNTLEGLIKDFDESIEQGSCQDYNDDGSSKGFRRIDNEMEEEIRNLLRQFAFIILQAHSPVTEYSRSTEEARAIVTKLRDNVLTKDNMDEYLKLWREQAADTGGNIPVILGEVLTGTDTQTGILETMLDDALNSLYTDIVDMVRDHYAEVPELLTSFNADFIANLTQTDPKRKVMSLILWIINTNKKCWTDLEKAQKDVKKAEGDLEECRKENIRLNEVIVATETERAKLNEIIKEQLAVNAQLQGKLASTEADRAALAERYDALGTKMADLQQQLTACNEKIRGLEPAVGTATKAAAEAEGRAAAALAAQKAAEMAAAQGAAAADKKLVEQNKKYATDLAQAEANVGSQRANTIRAMKDLAAQKSISDQRAISIDKLTQELNANLKAQEQLAADFAKTKAELNSNGVSSKAASDAAQAALDGALAKTAATKAQLDSAIQREREAQRTIEERDVEIVRLRSAAAAAAAGLAEAKAKEETLNASASAIQRSNDEKLAGMAAEIAAAKAANDALIADLTNKHGSSEEALAKALASAKAASEGLAAEQGKHKSDNDTMAALIADLQQFAADIKRDNYKVPSRIPGATKSFQEIVDKIAQMKATASPGNEICFLSYFIMFFMKFLFFTGPSPADIEKRKALMGSLQGMCDRVLNSVKGLMPGKTDKQVLYKIMGLIFAILDAGETIFITNKDRDGGKVFDGLTVVKTTEEPIDKDILTAIFAGFDKPDDATVNSIEKSLLDNMQITQPKIFIIPPIASLTSYASFVYLPDGKRPEDFTKLVKEVDVTQGYTSKEQRTEGPLEGSILKAMNSRTIHYTALFTAFVIFGRKYILTAKDDFSKYKCKIPHGLEDTSLLAGKVAPDLMSLRAASARQGVGAAQGAAQASTLGSGQKSVFGSISPLAPQAKPEGIIHLTPDNPEQIFPLILKELAGGATVTSGSFERVINGKIDARTPPAERAKILKLQPIIRLIKSYNTTSPFWRGVKFDVMPSQLIPSIWAKFQENIKGDDALRTKAKTYFTNLIYNMALAYTRQYNINPSTSADELKRFIGDATISLPGVAKPLTLYTLLNITNDKVIAFINNPPALITSGADEGLHLKKQ